MRYRAILGRLVARTAVHVGSGRGGEATDALLRRDVQGRFVIPGTALAGALRSVAARLAPRIELAGLAWTCRTLVADDDDDETEPCGCVVCQLFGEFYPKAEDDEETGGRAARLWVYDARPEGDPAGAPIRDLVGIERSTGAAARSAAAKFDLELLPAGTAFLLRLELDPDTGLEPERLLAAVLAEWHEGRGALGGRVARGLGAFGLDDLRLVSLPLDQPDGLMAFLHADRPWEASGATTDALWLPRLVEDVRRRVRFEADLPRATARCFATIEFDVQAESLFLTHDAETAVAGGFDHAPLLDPPGTDGRPQLPGSALRGVLRAQAERIARTLATQKAEDLTAFGALCPACDPLCNPPQDAEHHPLASCDALLRDRSRREKRADSGSAAPAQLCLACRLFGSPRLGSRLLVEDAPLAEGTSASFKAVDFLAIDRFTGGGREGAKFDALALWRPRFRARLHLDNPEPWELGWLVLVLRDLHDGLARLGFGAAKGFGRVTLENLTVRLGFLAAEDLAELTDGSVLDAPAPTGVYHQHTLTVPDLGARGAWSRLAESWVQAFASQQFHRTQREMVLQTDSYFGQQTAGAKAMTELYPKEASPRA